MGGVTVLVGDVLSELDRAPVIGLDDLVGAGGFVVLAPHPDDETLGCGGIVSAARDQRRPVEIVFLTDGSASHPGSDAFPAERLAALRKAEAEQAAALLGVAAEHLVFLGQPDAAAPRTGPIFARAVDALDRAVARTEATSLFVTWEHDPHCDHETAALVAGVVSRRNPGLRVWRYPIWGLHRAANEAIEQAPWRGVQVDVSRWLDRKRQALACHASQLGQVIDDDSQGFQLTSDMLAPFLSRYERFIGDPA